MSRGAKIALSIGLPVVIFVVIAIGGSIALGLMKPTPEPAEEAPRGIAVFTEEIVRTDLHLTVTSQGEVRPR